MTSKPIPARSSTLKAVLSNGTLWKVISLLVSVGLMVYVLSKIQLDDFFRLLRDVPAWSLIISFGMYIVLQTIRGVRFRTLLADPRPSLASMMPIIVYHNFLNRVLPFNTGELSYVVLINQRLKQPGSDTISSLVTARLFDLAMVLLAGAFGILSVSTDQFGSKPVLFVGLLAIFVAYMFALYYSGSLIRLSARIWAWAFAPRLVHRFPKLENAVEGRLHTLSLRFDRIHEPRLLLMTGLLSFLTYASSAAFDTTLLRGLGVTQPLGTLLAIISIKMFIEAIPVVVTGFGVIEGSWAFGLVTLAGLDVSTAASIGVFLHAWQVIAAGITGMIGYFILARSKAKQGASSEIRTTSS